MGSNRGVQFESRYPFFISTCLAIVTGIVLNCLNTSLGNLDKVIDGIITFSSIIIGFLGVLLAILLSIRNTEIITYIFAHTQKNVLLKYFRSAVISGLLLVIMSISMFFLKKFKGINLFNLFTLDKVLFLLWIYLMSYFFLSSYRIIDIVMCIVFKDPQATSKRPKSKKIEPDKEEALKKRYSMDKKDD